jgi:hypothetical protein
MTASTNLVTVTTPFTFYNGDSVTITGIIGTIGGVPASDVNGIKVVRTWNTTSFVIQAVTFATSHSSGGGGMGEISYNSEVMLFEHEVGTDDYNYAYTGSDSIAALAPMNSFVETNYSQLGEGDNTILIYSIIPDSQQVGNMSITVYTKLYPQGSVETVKGPFVITQFINKVDVMALGRQRKYRIGSNELGQDFLIGKWFEQIVERTPI